MTPAEVVAAHEGLILTISTELSSHEHPSDELAQEARVALWLEAERRPGDTLVGLASSIIRRRIHNVTRHGRTFGAADGRRWEPASEAVEGMSVPELAEVEYRRGVAPSAEDVALRRLLAEDVCAAVLQLTDDREYEVASARLRDEPVVETAARFGVSTATINNTWKRARANLAVALEGNQ